MTSPEPRDAFKEGSDYVQSLDRALTVILAFNQRGAMSQSELAEITGLSRAVVRRMLLTLKYLGYVSQSGRQFSLTPRILDLGFSYLSSLSVTEFALPIMEDVVRKTGESCSMSVLDGHEIVYVQRVAAKKIMAVTLGVGARLPAFCASMGRVLLGGLGEQELDSWLDDLTPQQLTGRTLTDRTLLRQEIMKVGAQGFAYVEQELELGLCSVAVPVRDRTRRVCAALNIGMPYSEGARTRAVKELVPVLREAATQIDRSLLTR
ncbi:IclR family transcriptional regulator domain-containing protein [Kordiimonas marina]|uniref:IclR family transcriptional regulator domain-containing protein n=1 Tax=Kordiimonas marina TaxID=2872312 RepID=UPI001FF5FB54|nr:IclR family transcriptional regulator C-terminal domain-containing protein [Kordiimonas marina]MCJ9430643.1 helix-turn-helix domain-containing protein [Kordiimonas marina]